MWTSVAACLGPFVILAAYARLFGARRRPATPHAALGRLRPELRQCTPCGGRRWAGVRPDGTALCWDHLGSTEPTESLQP